MSGMTTREELEVIRRGKGWNINPRLRQKILERLGDILDDNGESVRNHIAAAETVIKIELLEMQRQKIEGEEMEAANKQVQTMYVALPSNGTEFDDAAAAAAAAADGDQ